MEKTSIISIRVYNDEKKILMEESQKNNMTVNSLGRQIISKYIEWHRYTKDMGYTSITKSLLQTLFKKENDATIKIISILTHNTLKSTVLFMYGEFNLSNVLSVLDIWLGACNISFRHFTDFHIEKYVITHNMGGNFSRYLDMSLNSILNEVGHTTKNQINDESHITFEIERVSEK